MVPSGGSVLVKITTQCPDSYVWISLFWIKKILKVNNIILGNRRADAESIMKAASDIFKCKIILFTLDNDKFDTQVIDECGGTQLEAPLFIAASLEETNQFQSVVFKQEDENEYRQRFLRARLYRTFSA